MSEVVQAQGVEVRQVMTPVEVLPPDTTVQAATRVMVELGVDALPVGSSEQVEGIITDRDILIRLVAEGLDPAVTLARDVMSREVVACSPEDPVETAAATMELRQIRRMPVLDRDGKLVGMVGTDRPASAGRIAPAASGAADTPPSR